MLTKNPCIRPEDIRVVTCVSDEEVKCRLKLLNINLNIF